MNLGKSIVLILVLYTSSLSAQNLKLGFDKEEYKNMMYISANSTASDSYASKYPKPIGYELKYQSPSVGLKNSTKKAVDVNEKCLCDMAYKIVSKTLTEYEQPEYSKCNNYVRTGNTIVLFADTEYYKIYPDDKSLIFSTSSYCSIFISY